tara:strand:- start:111 stop:647 length:537 start_codon:yes stop_codon:yes gene_type:complete
MFYQFWRNCDDEVVIHFLKILTFLDAGDIAEMQRALEEDPGRRLPQIKLAQEITDIVHGDEGVQAAERITDALFANDIDSLAEEDLAQLALDGMSSTEISSASVSLVDVLVSSGLAVTPRGEVTQGQAKKLIKSNAVSVNGDKAEDEVMMLSIDSALYGKYLIVQKGKKNHHLVVFGG